MASPLILPPRPRGLLAAGALLIATLAANGQATRRAGEPELRGRVTGFVGDRTGRELPGAEVLLLSRPIPDRWDLGTEDLVTVRADDAGRFEANILRGRPYTAWSVFHRRGDPRRRISRAQDDVYPGTSLRLGEDPTRIPKTLRLQGAAAWAAHAPLRCHVFSLSTLNVFTAPVPLSEAGDLDLPLVPGDDCLVEVSTKEGKHVASFHVRLARPGGGDDPVAAAAVEDPPSEVQTLPLPEPLPVAFQITGVENTAPAVDGAEIYGLRHWHGREARSFLLGVTGKDGRATVLHPGVLLETNREGQETRVFHTYRIRAPGREILRVDGKGTTQTVRLWPGPTLSGRVTRADGAPAANLPLLVEEVSSKLGGFQISEYPIPTRTDGEGRFQLPGLQRKAAVRILTVLGEEEAQRAGVTLDKDVPLAPVAWLLSTLSGEREVGDLGTVSLAALQVLDLEVRMWDGQTATCPRLLLLPQQPGRPGWPQGSPVRAQGMRNGRLRLLVPRIAISVAAYLPGIGIGFLDLDAEPQGGKAAVRRATLRIDRPVEIEGRMVTDQGVPIADAELHVMVDDHRARNEFMEEFLGEATAELQPFRSDGQGRFRAFLPSGLECRLGARALTRKGWFTSYDKQAIRVGEGKTRGLEVRAPALQ